MQASRRNGIIWVSSEAVMLPGNRRFRSSLGGPENPMTGCESANRFNHSPLSPHRQGGFAYVLRATAKCSETLLPLDNPVNMTGLFFFRKINLLCWGGASRPPSRVVFFMPFPNVSNSTRLKSELCNLPSSYFILLNDPADCRLCLGACGEDFSADQGGCVGASRGMR